MDIYSLNEYVLIKIFSYCDNKDLENLYFVCKLFRWIVEKRMYFIKSRSLLLCGHNTNLERNSAFISYRDRLRINSNWLSGRYSESLYFPNSRFYASKILLDKDFLYKSNGEYIRLHKRSKIDAGDRRSNGEYIRIHRRSKIDAVDRKYSIELKTSTKSDITDFQLRDGTIFAGRICGNSFIYKDGDIMEQRLHDVNDYISSVDFLDDVFVTTSEKTCKLWSRTTEFGLSNLELVKDYKTSYKTIRISNSARFFGGKYSDRNRLALNEIDIETGDLQVLNSETFSIYDIKLKDDNVIFTANFDSTFRMFDRRTNSDECIWMDPFDASIYCLEYDGLYAVLCGMKYHCRVNLYDIRVPGDYIQMYFPNLRRSYGSPVYSLTCDSRYLFIATDRNVRVFDFKADYAPSKDYRNIFVNRILIKE